MFPGWTKALMLAFAWLLCKGGFSNFAWYNLALGLLAQTRCNDLDHVSRPQLCQNHKLQIMCCIFVSAVVQTFMFAKYIKKVKHNMLCVI